MPRTEVSLIVPVLNEAENLRELHRRVTVTLGSLGCSYEVVFVDDGSTDATPSLLQDLVQHDPQVRVVRLAYNCGQHAALLAGFRHATGALVVTVDADMQTPPEEIPALLTRIEEGFDVVFGVFATRHHPLCQRVASAIGHVVVERALRVPRGVRFSPFRALRRPLIDRLIAFRGNPVQLEVLLGRYAARMGAVTVRHEPRHAGETKYSLSRRARFVCHLVRGLRAVRHNRGASLPQYVVAERLGFGQDRRGGDQLARG